MSDRQLSLSGFLAFLSAHMTALMVVGDIILWAIVVVLVLTLLF